MDRNKTKKLITIRKMIAILYVISVFEVIARNLFGPVFAAFVLHIGGNLLASGTALAINTAIVGICIIFSGRIASRYHTEKIQLVMGYGIAALAYLAYSFVRTPHQLFLVEAVAGFSSALEVPAFSGLFSSLQEKAHAKAWGDYFGVMNFISAGALLASGAIAQRFGFDTLFYVMFAFETACMISAVMLFRYE